MATKRLLPEIKQTFEQYHASAFGDERSPESRHLSGFDDHHEGMKKLSFPDMQPFISMKDRITLLEEGFAVQQKMNKLTYDTFTDVSNDLHSTDIKLQNAIDAVEKRFTAEIAQLRREYDHRFELQLAENRRLQQNFSALKAESSQTNKKLVLTIEKLRALQLEFGVDENDDVLDEFSVLAQTVSRPATSNEGTLGRGSSRSNLNSGGSQS